MTRGNGVGRRNRSLLPGGRAGLGIPILLALGLGASGHARGAPPAEKLGSKQEALPQAAGQARAEAKTADYHQIQAFTNRVPDAARVERLGDLLTSIQPVVQAGLLTSPKLTQRPVAVVASQVTAAEVLDALAVVAGARWYRLGERVWVMAGSPQEALAIQAAEERRRESYPGESAYFRQAAGSLQKLARSLTREQWSHLEQGGLLDVRSLDLAQRGLFRNAVAAFVAHPGPARSYTPHPEALNGQGYLRVVPTEGKPRGKLEFFWPTLHRTRGGPPGALLMLEKNNDGRWQVEETFQAANPVPVPLPILTSPPPDYRTVPSFAAQLALATDEAGWAELIDGLGKETRAALLAEGEWLAKPPPFRKSQLTAREVLEKMASLSKKRWEHRGGFWVLVPKD